MKKVLFLIMVLTVLMSGTVMAANVKLSDISGHWAEKYIKTLVNDGVINGYEDGTYRPEGTIKKGEFIKLIMAASVPSDKFTSSNKYSHWASAYIEAAEDYGVISKNAINDSNANSEISRAEVVEILGRCDITIKGTMQDVTLLNYNDIDSLTNWEYIMLAHCTKYGYIMGYEDGTFKPNKTLTRAEVATILYRYMYN